MAFETLSSEGADQYEESEVSEVHDDELSAFAKYEALAARVTG